jgi:hypothetical protein
MEVRVELELAMTLAVVLTFDDSWLKMLRKKALTICKKYLALLPKMISEP